MPELRHSDRKKVDSERYIRSAQVTIKHKMSKCGRKEIFVVLRLSVKNVRILMPAQGTK